MSSAFIYSFLKDVPGSFLTFGTASSARRNTLSWPQVRARLEDGENSMAQLPSPKDLEKMTKSSHKIWPIALEINDPVNTSLCGCFILQPK